MKPLENVKVLDLTRVLAGPFCTMILSDLGAEVIKVEVPKTGDDARQYGPFKNNKSAYFLSVNRGKKSISLNLKSEKGKEILRKLVAKVDVFMENFRPGTLEKLGLGYDELQKINPKLIYAATSGFGHTGPMSKKPAYDVLMQAMSGIMSITGWPDTPPTRVGMSFGDISAGLYTAIAVNAALYQRTVTGKGLKIDISMLDCQVQLLENAIVRYQVEEKVPSPIGNRHPTITPFQAYKATDGYFALGVGNDSLWKLFCQVIKREDLIDNADFKTNKLRTQNIVKLNEILDAIFAGNTVEYWLNLIEGAGVPCSPYNTIDKLMKNEQIYSRNMIIDAEDKDMGSLKIAGNPIKMSTFTESMDKVKAPEIGEHNHEILKEMLNFSDTEIDELFKQDVI